MIQLPTITTRRLVLRPFELADAADLQQAVGRREIAGTTIRIPHPYPDGEAERWIGTLVESYLEGRALNLAITHEERLVGAIGLEMDPDHEHGELGYWIAVPAWGRGFASEAAAAMVEHGFKTLGLHRIHAHYMASNPASGRVLRKIGMQHEGVLRQHLRKWDRWEDLELYALLRENYDGREHCE